VTADAPDMALGGPKKMDASDPGGELGPAACSASHTRQPADWSRTSRRSASGGDHRQRHRVEHKGMDRVRDSVVTGTPRIEGRARADTCDSFVDQRTN
jgi:hypothetical protein